jgi:hypothetical protein
MQNGPQAEQLILWLACRDDELRQALLILDNESLDHALYSGAGSWTST